MTMGPRPPSLRERVDASMVEYPLALPKSRPLVLRFGAAASDGALFRVRALAFDAAAGEDGAVLWEKRVTSRTPEEVEVDLARYAGQNVRLQLESAGQSGQAYWAEPTLVAGKAPEPASFPPPAGARSRLLGAVRGYEARVWPGSRGALDSAIGLVSGERRLLFRGFRIQMLGDDLGDWRSASELLEAREEPANGRYRVRHHFRSWAGTFDLLTEMWVDGRGLQTRFWLENEPPRRPWLSIYLQGVAAGPWTERATRIYGGPGNVIQEPQAFRLGFDGHSLATSFVGFDFANGVSLVQGVDVTPGPAGSGSAGPHLHAGHAARAHGQLPAGAERLGGREDLARPTISAPSAGVPKLAGRFVFDLWGGRYGRQRPGPPAGVPLRADRRDGRLAQLAAVGLRLPPARHLSAQPELGTLEEFQKLVQACREAGVLFAPHDNYIDSIPTPRASATRTSPSAATASRSAPGSTTAATRSPTAPAPTASGRSWNATSS